MIVSWTDFDGYFSGQNLRLALVGASAAALAVVTLRQMLGRAASGWLAGAVGSAVGLYLTDWLDRLDWTDPDELRLTAATTVAALAGLGFEQLRSASRIQPWVPALVLLTCCGGVWLAVPENSPIVVVAGVVVGLALGGRITAPGVGYGLAAAAAWSVLVGARSTGFSFDGGLLCLAPLAVVPLVSRVPCRRRFRLPAWPWLVVGSGGVAFAAARWVGVAPDATWWRIAGVSGAALIVAWAASPVK